MNKHVLLTMKYLDDNNSVTTQELLDNYKVAAEAADTAEAAADVAYAADVYTDSAYAKNTIVRYFNITGENKQDYINEIAKNKGE